MHGVVTKAYGDLGFSFSMMGKHDEAIANAEQAVVLDPNSAEAHAMLAHTLRFAGRHEESIPEYKKAVRLNPIPPAFYLFGLGRAYSLTGQYEEAIKWCEKAVRQDPDSLVAHLVMTLVYSTSGREEDARAEAAEVLRIDQRFSLEKFEKIKQSIDKKLSVEALRKAGLPD